MSEQAHPLDYPSVCKYVGQLFLESRHEIEQAKLREESLRRQLAQAQSERDEALRLASKAKG